MQLHEARHGSELRETGALIVAAQGALGEKIHGNQYAEQQRKEGECEFCEKITPHEPRTVFR